MQPIVLARIAHVLSFTEVLRELGAPVDRELRRVGLPTLLDEQPDGHVPVLAALKFFRQIEHLEGLEDLGFLAAGRETLNRLAEGSQFTLQDAPTLRAALGQFAVLAPRESTNCRISFCQEGTDTRICNNLHASTDGEDLRFSEWIQIAVIVEIIRDALGEEWCPAEISFKSVFTPCDSAFEEFGGTAFLFGQGDTSIKLPSSLMAQPYGAPRARHSRVGSAESRTIAAEAHLDFGSSLRLALRTHLREGCIDVHLAAEIAGTSVRTLQRRLSESGLSYSGLIDQIHFDVAVDLMQDPAMKLYEIAQVAGYNDPSHFSRAFRRVAGISPREYRRSRFTRRDVDTFAPLEARSTSAT
ncbi:MAG: AraC family transcriptional regulator [bacterium]|nr:AraC family transcriptional regulator [bacterium]